MPRPRASEATPSPAAPPRRSPAGDRGREALAFAVLAAGIALALAGGWAAGLLGGAAARWLYVLTVGALINAACVAGFLRLQERWARRRRERDRYARELRYFRLWAGEEGVLRKVGLLRDLDALGAVPGDLEQILLPGADLRGLGLGGANLREADLRGANLQGAALEGANLWGADLSGANLTLAGLAGASLRGCDLRGAVLVKADLQGANLHRADLVGANLEGAVLAGARLERARFAAGTDDELQHSIHPSVEDWIREGLDAQGRYRPAGPEAGRETGAPGGPGREGAG